MLHTVSTLTLVPLVGRWRGGNPELTRFASPSPLHFFVHLPVTVKAILSLRRRSVNFGGDTYIACNERLRRPLRLLHGFPFA